MKIMAMGLALLACGAASAGGVDDYTGSYVLAPGHVVDIGPMDEVGGQLVFIEHPSLRIGVLQAQGEDRFVAGAALGTPAPPAAFHADFFRDPRSRKIGRLDWASDAGQFAAPLASEVITLPVAVRNGDIELKGVIQRPATPGPHPAIVFAHGSGGATRNVGVCNTWFVRQGFAVLSLDKRGAGESSGDWHVASLDDIASDWLAGVAWLKTQRDIDKKRIGVHGSSQGGWTAPRMAARSRDIAFVIVRAGSALPLLDTMAYEVGWSVREAGFDAAQGAAAEAAARRVMALAARRAPWPELAAELKRHAGEPWVASAWPLQMTEDGWGREWLAVNAGIDNAALPALRVPVLWYLADHDHNVPSDASAARLQEAGPPDLTLVRLADAGHGFAATATGNGNEMGLATHMAAGYWDTMAAWLRERGFAPAQR
jgi:dienelactone hydrolase